MSFNRFSNRFEIGKKNVQMISFNYSLRGKLSEKEFQFEVREGVTLTTSSNMLGYHSHIKADATYITSHCSLVILHPYRNGVCINTLSVIESLRGKGIGTNIMNALIEVADNLNIPLYLIPMEIDSTPIDVVRKFYKKCGFKRMENSVYWKYRPSISLFDYTADGHSFKMVYSRMAS